MFFALYMLLCCYAYAADVTRGGYARYFSRCAPLWQAAMFRERLRCFIRCFYAAALLPLISYCRFTVATPLLYGALSLDFRHAATFSCAADAYFDASEHIITRRRC